MLPKMYFIGSTVLILISIIAGFFFIESPQQQRLRNEDQARINNLLNVDGSIMQYASISGKLPADLNAIQVIEGMNVDPVTKEPFDYRITGETTYELCGTFVTSNKEASSEYYYGPDWLHDAGPTCFKRSVINQLPDKTRALMAPAPIQ
jgi:type II secretory pathway pseudopilin PulG